MKLCDIHTHILPSIDDGPDTIEETVEIIKLSRIQNVFNIVATPVSYTHLTLPTTPYV